MNITPEMLESAYVHLSTCRPFRGWKLPSPDDVVFIVTHRKHEHGDCEGSDPPKISISALKTNSAHDLISTMAHEKLHLYLYLRGYKNWEMHGPLFRRHSIRICRELGFDPEAF